MELFTFLWKTFFVEKDFYISFRLFFVDMVFFMEKTISHIFSGFSIIKNFSTIFNPDTNSIFKFIFIASEVDLKNKSQYYSQKSLSMLFDNLDTLTLFI